jgi:hypothetical protein
MRHGTTSLPSVRCVRRFAICALSLLLSACLSEPVKWGDVSYRRSQLGDPDTRSAVFSADLPSTKDAASPCLRSIRTASAGSNLYRVWWTSRPDSSVVLSVQRSSDGGQNWGPPVTVDSRDRGGRGCNRPAPAIAYDPAHHNVHLVYFLEATDGPGVFLAHSMDNGATFHAPVPVVYGNRPSAASVAANGDSVVVVFEDPNATTPRIGIVLSHTTGHIFEGRGEATPDDVSAIDPWVALTHRTITVWWKEGENREGTRGDRVGYRTGTWN